MTITELQQLAHSRAKEKGFWPVEMVRSEETPEGFKSFTRESQLHISEKLALIHSELGEATEALRKELHTMPHNLNTVISTDKDDVFERRFKTLVKDTFEDELADALIRLLDLAGACGINLQTHVEQKLRYNATREHLHGKKF